MGPLPRRSAAAHIVKICTGARSVHPPRACLSLGSTARRSPLGGGDHVAAVSVTGTYSGVNISGRKGPRKGLLTREGQNISQRGIQLEKGPGMWHRLGSKKGIHVGKRQTMLYSPNRAAVPCQTGSTVTLIMFPASLF